MRIKRSVTEEVNYIGNYRQPLLLTVVVSGVRDIFSTPVTDN